MSTANGSQWPRWALLSAGGLALLVGGYLWLGPLGKQTASGAEPSFKSHAYQTTDKLLVSVTVKHNDEGSLKGTLQVELLDADGKVVASKEQKIEQEKSSAAYRFELPAVKQALDKFTLRYGIGKHQSETPVSKVLLQKAHETALSISTEFHAGTTTAMRCQVQGVKSLTETVPLAEAAIEVSLKDKAGKVHELYKGKAGDDGVAAIKVAMPSLPPGAYTMEVATKSALGEEKLTREIKLKAEPKLMLITDKPLYQPGQLIHMRALCLGAFDLKPVGESKILFEVEDSKSNKVFKREQTTSAHGVAAIDFQLASEVNQGEYKVRAILGDKQTEKSVTVKPYVLPKFKSALTADKKFYMPKETIKADLQVDYFFGKPVAGGKVAVKASTFDVEFKDFFQGDLKTDAQGHVKFEVKLPDHFVGQPIAKGNAIVKIEVKVTDTADHAETITKTFPVSDKAIQVSLLPEAGRLVPGVENRVFAAALQPDGSPAKCEIQLSLNKEVKDKFLGKAKTNDAGLAEFKFVPDAKHFRPGEHKQHDVEILGGKRQVWGPTNLLDLKVVAEDGQKNRVEIVAALSSEALGDNVLLRLDKAVYKGGDTMKIDLLSSAGMPTVYFDLVRDNQTLLTKWFDVKDGKASMNLDLPPDIFGTIEAHAYQMLASGEIIRDARVLYVQPASELKIDVKADKGQYRPGDEGTIKFTVTDQAGKPTAAALGVIIVDEAVYALQEMQPGLEKVYFTLQQELLKPQVQVNFSPGETIDTLVREQELNANQQQIAQALLCNVKPKPPELWAVNPALGRKQKFENDLTQVGGMLYHEGAEQNKDVLTYDKDAKRAKFAKGILEYFFERKFLPDNLKIDPLGRQLALENLSALDKDFTADNLARAITAYRMDRVANLLSHGLEGRRGDLFKDGKWNIPDDVWNDLVKKGGWSDPWLKDGWGGTIKLIRRAEKSENKTRLDVLNQYALASAGPDQKFGTEDDFVFGQPTNWKYASLNWRHLLGGAEQFDNDNVALFQRGDFRRMELRDQIMREMPKMAADGGRFGGDKAPGGAFPKDKADKEAKNTREPTPDSKPGKGGGGEGGPPVRLREYFPETMLWRPLVITDAQGKADLKFNFADSITTWRLTASASSSGGLLGGVSAPLTVFQDFFVDLDLPVALTKNDELTLPVPVYNYLKEPQTIKIELAKEEWFELLAGDYTSNLDVKPDQVTVVKFRIKAKKVGFHPFTVTAKGSKMSDAIKRIVEVVPDGQMKEVVVTDRLSGKVKQTINIPENAIPDASKILVKVYPGVFSQVLEGVEGMIRLPGG